MKQLILGIDPGSRCAGFGLITVDGDHVTHVHHGAIVLPEKAPLPQRLNRLHIELQRLYTAYPVTCTVVEKVFFGKNAASAFVLGQARGVCLQVTAQHNVGLAEYAARYVKKCVTGSGAATKDHVQMVVFNLLRVRPNTEALDASDALALAITHARVAESAARVRQAMEGSL